MSPADSPPNMHLTMPVELQEPPRPAPPPPPWWRPYVLDPDKERTVPQAAGDPPDTLTTDDLLAGRDASTVAVARFLLDVNPNLPQPLAFIAGKSRALARGMLLELPDGPELVAGLRKLLEAKDCFVRAATGR